MKLHHIIGSILIVFGLSVSIIVATSTAQQRSGRRPQDGPLGVPPQEALSACENKYDGDLCEFRSPHGIMNGTCRTIQTQSACVPDDMPPGDPQDNQQDGLPQGQRNQAGGRRERSGGRKQQQTVQRSITSSQPYTGAIQLSNNLNDTSQNTCYNNSGKISCPEAGKDFYGQDAHYLGKSFAFQDNGDGTVSDLNTGLMWQKSPDLDNKSTYAEAVAEANTFNLTGHNDWRLPTVKELYSLIDFNGSQFTKTPYIDTKYFDFRFGEESRGERTIDAQYWTSTEYVGTVFNGQAVVFGVNFADGRIKGYPKNARRNGRDARFVRYVRGNSDYGINIFVENDDSTISDLPTGLMWQQTDSAKTMNWEDALGYCENLDYVGYNNWRLPNAKELQSIVDYTRAPDAQDPTKRGPAIDPIFDITETESWYWTSTTLLESPPDRGFGSQAVYLTFGQAFGYMEDRRTGQKTKMNVHGAGAQRSDPKNGNPDNWSGGRGPQGDEVRIYNYARCVRDL